MQISAVGKDNTNSRDNLNDVLSVRLNNAEKKTGENVEIISGSKEKKGEKERKDGTRWNKEKKRVGKIENQKLRTSAGVELTALTLAHIR